MAEEGAIVVVPYAPLIFHGATDVPGEEQAPTDKPGSDGQPETSPEPEERPTTDPKDTIRPIKRG